MTAWHDWLPVAVREFRGHLAKNGNTVGAVKTAEKKLGLTFPKRYREFIAKWNGGELRLRLLSLAEVVNDAAGKRGDETDPLGELPQHLVPIAAEPHGVEVLCVSRAKKVDERVFLFDPGAPDSLRSFPDFEALLLERVSGAGFRDGPDGDYLKAVVTAHGVDWADDEPLAKWKPFEECKAEVPRPPKAQKKPTIKLENFRPGSMSIPSKGEAGLPSLTGLFARGVFGVVTPVAKDKQRWMLNVSTGAPDKGTSRELSREELGVIAAQLATFVKARGYESDKHWSGMLAALAKASAN
jgi:hypothetical protein